MTSFTFKSKFLTWQWYLVSFSASTSVKYTLSISGLCNNEASNYKQTFWNKRPALVVKENVQIYKCANVHLVYITQTYKLCTLLCYNQHIFFPWKHHHCAVMKTAFYNCVHLNVCFNPQISKRCRFSTLNTTAICKKIKTDIKKGLKTCFCCGFYWP